MTAVVARSESYVEEFSRFNRERLSGGVVSPDGSSWLSSIREDALDGFSKMGFPTTRQEEWKYTSVAPIASLPFRLSSRRPGSGLPLDLVPKDGPAADLVFVDGVLHPEISKSRRFPDGVIVTSLRSAVRDHRDLVEPHLAKVASREERPFVALNTAFLDDGAFVHVPDGVAIAEPINVLHVSAPAGGATASCPRTLVVAGRRSQLSFVESYAGASQDAYFTNAVTEIVVGDGAVIEHHKLQREGSRAFHVAAIQARIARSAAFTSHSVSLGAVLTRNDLSVVLDDEGGDCTLNGLYLTSGSQHVDNHTLIDHAKAHCSSRELYKGVLGGRSRGVFDGKIIVRKDAQKTDARQTNKNLLISDEALMDTKPQLEINADDVKCTHAATIGQLDRDSLFYLRTRAIGPEEARDLLMRAFVSDVLARIRIDAIRGTFEGHVRDSLAQAGKGRTGS